MASSTHFDDLLDRSPRLARALKALIFSRRIFPRWRFWLLSNGMSTPFWEIIPNLYVAPM